VQELFTTELADSIEIRPLKLGIIGTGVVGRAAAVAFAKPNNILSLYDISLEQEQNAAMVLKLALREDYFRNIRFCPDIEEACRDADYLMICVPTPMSLKKEPYDYSIIDQVMDRLSDKVAKNNTTIVVRSTVDPFWLTKKSQEFRQKLWFVPEFLREQTYLTDAINPPHIIIGLPNFQPETIKNAEQLFSQFKCPKYATTLETAALVKLFRNAFLATKISLFNEIGRAASQCGEDAQEVAKLVALDGRIGDYGSKVGKPYGGKCLPKDVDALNKLYDCAITRASQSVNDKLLEVTNHAE
jgi:UDPglucose 6-dehydrogenase